MSVADRILAAIGVLILVLLLAAAGTVAWLAHAYGTLAVEVREIGPGGDEVSLRIPGALARIGAAFVPGDVLRESAGEIRDWLPAARAAIGEIRRCPDARLVDVRSREGTVRISKRDGEILVEVASRHETVRVVIPLPLASAVLDGLGDRMAALAGEGV